MLLGSGGAGDPLPGAPVPTPLPPGTWSRATTWPGVQDGGGGKDTELISPLPRAWLAVLKAI